MTNFNLQKRGFCSSFKYLHFVPFETQALRPQDHLPGAAAEPPAPLGSRGTAAATLLGITQPFPGAAAFISQPQGFQAELHNHPAQPPVSSGPSVVTSH